MKETNNVQTRRPMLLVVTEGMYNAIQREVFLGVDTCAKSNGWTIAYEWGRPRNIAKLVRRWRPKSVLAVWCTGAAITIAASLAPTVVAVSDVDQLELPGVDLDHAAIAQMAARHLLGLGLKHFAVHGDWRFGWAAGRARAFARRVEEAGGSCVFSSGRELKESEVFPILPRVSLRRWLKGLPKPVGIFACADRVAMPLASDCRSVGVRVPEDAAIIGVDNDNVICEMSEPPLSSIAVNWQQIGYDAAKLAGRLAEGERIEPTRRLIPPAGIVARRSSDPLAFGDPDVAAALRVIREHAGRRLSVRELLRHVPVHRIRLEWRFRELVGRRILQEVRRVHVNEAKRLLASSDLPMSDVAEQSGFANASTLSIAFRQETGQTPTDYRSQFRLRR